MNEKAALVACWLFVATSQSVPPPVHAAEAGDAEVDITKQRQKGRTLLFSWQPWAKETFDRAKRENRLILLDGAAEWCHWCHVMDETTYLDPQVGALIRDRFVAIRVDVDQRPDVAARYEDYGWPATVLFTKDAKELGKFRGYLSPSRMLDVLQGALSAKDSGESPAKEPRYQGILGSPALLPWIASRTALEMDERYHEEEGGWGRGQKLPIGGNLEFDLRRATRGEADAKKRAFTTLAKQAQLIDPVFGGMYQYSTGGTWNHPHYEKLLPVQTAAIEAYARGYLLSKDPAHLRWARQIATYLNRFLSAEDGAFYVSQDADLGGYEKGTRFVPGAVYYKKDEAGRKALGIPRVDKNIYARESGLGIAAFCVLYEASKDPADLARAKRAAERMLRTHLLPDGGVRRQEGKPDTEVRYLADAAALGRGLALLANLSGEPHHKDAALRIAKALLRDFADRDSGRLFVSTKDPAATGIFERREQPFAHNVLAARFLAETKDPSHKTKAIAVLSGIATPKGVLDQGRVLGDFLLAVDDVGLFPF